MSQLSSNQLSYPTLDPSYYAQKLDRVYGTQWFGVGYDELSSRRDPLPRYRNYVVVVPLPTPMLLTVPILALWLRGHLRRRRLGRRGFAVEPAGAAEPADAPPA